jgi:hypothetical protein
MRLVVILVLVLGGVARAENAPPAPRASAPEKKPVRVGPTTVTVIDEQESVDDIISRVRRSRQPRAVTPPPPVVQPPSPPAASPEDRKARREAKAEERASRKQVRERLQRLRETARDRRANRRGARGE